MGSKDYAETEDALGRLPDHMDDMVTLTRSDQASEELAAPAASAENVTITNNEKAGAYELAIDGRTAAGVLYTETGSRVTLLATAVFPEFRGQGNAGKLLGAVLEMLRPEQRTVTLACSYAAAFVQSHPEYADIVDPTFPGSAQSHGHGDMS